VTGKTGPHRSLRSVSLEVAIFLAVLLAAQFEHHDLACHAKSPLHYTACASAQVGLETRVGTAAHTAGLADAGGVITYQSLPNGTRLPVRSTGRSPPPQA